MKAYLGIGSNIGDRNGFIAKALQAINEENIILEKSSIYETEPVGYKDQGKFLNAVILVETRKTPQQLLAHISKIESSLDRERIIKNGPRTIDIDILFFESKIIQEDALTIPHPRAHEREFVLQPMCDINKDLIHPVYQKTMATLLEGLQNDKK